MLSKTSYSQIGEDLVLEYYLNYIGKKSDNITYLDIGSNHPIYGNNTFLFYSKGSKGVLVEPNSLHWDLTKSSRPEDVLLEMGVATEDGELDFYEMSAQTLNTCVKDVAHKVAVSKSYGKQNIDRVTKIPVIAINRLLKDNFRSPPNIVSIDIEGLEYDIINSWDFDKYDSDLLCIEMNYNKNDIINILNRNYNIISDNSLNMIFMHKKYKLFEV